MHFATARGGDEVIEHSSRNSRMMKNTSDFDHGRGSIEYDRFLLSGVETSDWLLALPFIPCIQKTLHSF